MSILGYIRRWIINRELRIPVSKIRESLNELQKGEILSKHGKELLATAIINTNQLENLLLPESEKDSPQLDKLTSTSSGRVKEVLLVATSGQEKSEHFNENLLQDYQIEYVNDGARALDMARQINPDIIVADAMLPVMNGYDLCRALKSSVGTSHMPVILLSALSDKESVIFGLEAGANDYIAKPLDFDILKARIRNILQSREELRNTVFTDTRVGETNYTNELDIEFLDKAKRIVEKELANPEFSINDLCSMLAMSRTSVYNKLKTLTGQPPNDFIRIIRLSKAKGLLASKKYSVSEISNMVGFTDPRYFSTSFKKHFGISPSKV